MKLAWKEWGKKGKERLIEGRVRYLAIEANDMNIAVMKLVHFVVILFAIFADVAGGAHQMRPMDQQGLDEFR
jgi:hypothetical protein